MSRKKEEINLNLEHPYWDLDVAYRGIEWLDKVIAFLNRC